MRVPAVSVADDAFRVPAAGRDHSFGDTAFMPRVSGGTAALVRAGTPVWSPGVLRAAARPTAVGGSWLRRGTQSSTALREALPGGDHRCRTLVDGLNDLGAVASIPRRYAEVIARSA
jgi:hypothetical protein